MHYTDGIVASVSRQPGVIIFGRIFCLCLSIPNPSLLDHSPSGNRQVVIFHRQVGLDFLGQSFYSTQLQVFSFLMTQEQYVMLCTKHRGDVSGLRREWPGGDRTELTCGLHFICTFQEALAQPIAHTHTQKRLYAPCSPAAILTSSCCHQDTVEKHRAG